MENKETYSEIKHRFQDEFNNLPMRHCGFAAAGDKASAEAGMLRFANEWGYDDMAEFYKNVQHVGYGLFVRKADAHLIKEWMERQEREMSEFLKDDENIIEALLYEFGNHEVAWGGDWETALDAIGLTHEECFRNGRDLFDEAKDMYLKKIFS